MLKNYDLRTWAEVSLDAIENNHAVLSSALAPGMKRLAVVKADAYGHGAPAVAKTLLPDVDYFAVACAAEGAELRECGIAGKNILILGHTSPHFYPLLFEHDLIPAIYDVDEAKVLDREAAKRGTVQRIHIAVNTGMNRIGFEPDDDGIRSVCEIASMKNLMIDGIFSHFANADDPIGDEYTEYQLSSFRTFTQKLIDNRINIGLRHLYNSAGIIRLNGEFDMAREGICLYGLSPSACFSNDLTHRLRPAMSFRSEVIHIHNVKSGGYVGYGCRFRAERDTLIATVCAGYADGVPRLLSNKGFVLVEGKRAPITGNVCMDQFMCDVTDIEGVHKGSVVTLIGSDGNESIGADEVAGIANTISYEVICGVSKRVPRVYLKGGKLISVNPIC